MTKRLKRPRDPVQLAKLIGDIASGQVEDAKPGEGKDKAAAALGSRGRRASGKHVSRAKGGDSEEGGGQSLGEV